MKKILVGMVAAAILVGLTGCFWFPQPEGIIRITLNPNRIATQSIQSKTIPANGDYVRVRIWHQASPVNIVKTLVVQTSSETVDITLPAKAGYRVDCVSYDFDGRLLTGDRATGVNVTSGETTTVSLMLEAWSSGCSGDTACEALASFNVLFNLGAGGGLVSDAFGVATLLGSYTSFQDPTTSLPSSVLAVGDIGNSQVSLTGTMPDTDTEAMFYSVASVRMIAAWSDQDRPSGPVTLHMELPNRHMGETIHETLITPPSGGIGVTIE